LNQTRRRAHEEQSRRQSESHGKASFGLTAALRASLGFRSKPDARPVQSSGASSGWQRMSQ
jgi:hypothetical protein